MDYQIYLLSANVAVWLGIGGYLLLLGARQRHMETRIMQMERLRDGE